MQITNTITRIDIIKVHFPENHGLFASSKNLYVANSCVCGDRCLKCVLCKVEFIAIWTECMRDFCSSAWTLTEIKV